MNTAPIAGPRMCWCNPTDQERGVAGLKRAATGIEGVLSWKDTIEKYAGL